MKRHHNSEGVCCELCCLMLRHIFGHSYACFCCYFQCSNKCVAAGKGVWHGHLECRLGDRTIPAMHCKSMKVPDTSCDNPVCVPEWKTSDWKGVSFILKLMFLIANFDRPTIYSHSLKGRIGAIIINAYQK